VRAKRVCIYLSMPTGEIQTEKIVKHAFSQGKEVFVPYLYKPESLVEGYPKGRIMDMVKLRDEKDYESLERDTWGIPTVGLDGIEKRESILQQFGPKMHGSPSGLELILMPGVAFERDTVKEKNGVKRLGHGKGFYDFFLHRYGLLYGPLERPPQLYGLALKEQLLLEGDGLHVPMGDLDHTLHGLLVGDGEIIQ